jgi:hypothetical protein
MASVPIGRRGLTGLVLTFTALLGAMAAGAVAQPVAPQLKPGVERPKQAIPPGAAALPSCPLLNPQDPAAIQPLRLDPAQVALKNRIGCLSMQDAIYGRDGCPLRLCGERYANPLQLPGG